jgi:hypothetical protein
VTDIDFPGMTIPASDDVTDAEAIQRSDVEVPIAIRSDGGARVGGGVDDPSIAQALAAKAATAALRKSRKEDRQRREIDASARKSLQVARNVEIGNKKRPREKATIVSYFLSTRNFSSSTAVPATPSIADAPAIGDVTCAASSDNTPPRCSAAVDKVTVPDLHGTVSLDAASMAGSKGFESDDVEILASTLPPIAISTDSSISEDNPNWHIFHDVPVHDSIDGDDSDEEEYVNFPPPPKKTKKNYDLTRRFQMEWSAKASWNEMILTSDGLLHMVKCSICSTVRGRAVIMGPKWDTVRRHGKRVCHLKNTEIYASRRPTTVLQQMQGCNILESRKKVNSLCFIPLLVLALLMLLVST